MWVSSLYQTEPSHCFLENRVGISRISGLIPRKTGNPEFPTLSGMWSAESWMVWSTCRHVGTRPVSTWIWLIWTTWKAVFAIHCHTRYLPNWINTCEPFPDAVRHLLAGGEVSRPLAVTSAGESQQNVLAGKLLETLQNSSDLLCPFPASQFHVEFIQGASQLQKGSGRIWKWGNQNLPLAPFVLSVWH